MKFGHWLNSLTWVDHLVILLLFALCSWFAHLTMKGFRLLVEKTQHSPYAEEFRTSPFVFFCGCDSLYNNSLQAYWHLLN